MPQQQTIRVPADRRSRRRYPIEHDVRYKCVSGQRVLDEGAGKVVDISSGGVRFTTERTLGVGKKVEITVAWPVLIDNKCLLKLVINGWVIRSDSKSAAVKIEHYEFRTRASKPISEIHRQS